MAGEQQVQPKGEVVLTSFRTILEVRETNIVRPVGLDRVDWVQARLCHSGPVMNTLLPLNTEAETTKSCSHTTPPYSTLSWDSQFFNELVVSKKESRATDG